MAGYDQPCREFDICNALIEKYWESEQFEECFRGHLKLAEETGYPLAECQVGYFYLEGIGVEKDLERAFYWTERGAAHGDRDAQYNLAQMYEQGIGTKADQEKALCWYGAACAQGHDLAKERCEALNAEKSAAAARF